jgi:DNA-directed RNA polymerase specialized sigma24 family protein
MSKMAELAYDIEQLYIEGMSARQIANELDCPVELVLGWIEGQGVDA